MNLEHEKFSETVAQIVDERVLQVIFSLGVEQSNENKMMVKIELHTLVTSVMDAYNHHLSRIREQQVCDTTITADSVISKDAPDTISSDTSKALPEKESELPLSTD